MQRNVFDPPYLIGDGGSEVPAVSRLGNPKFSCRPASPSKAIIRILLKMTLHLINGGPPLTQAPAYSFPPVTFLTSCTPLPPPSLASPVNAIHDSFTLPAQAPSQAPGPPEPFVVVSPPSAPESTHPDGPDDPDQPYASEIAEREEEQMKAVRTKATIGVLSTLISYVCINSYLKTNYPDLFIWQDEDREEASWMATSKSWLDQKACRWLGVCGGLHMHFISEHDKFGHRPLQKKHRKMVKQPADWDWDWQHAWTGGKDRPEDWTDDDRVLREIPDYVMEYAPLVHLYSGEQFWPCDIAEHLYHVTPSLNYTHLQSEQRHQTLETLDELNKWDNGRWVFLTSNDNVEERPEWLEGEKNIPTAPADPEDTFSDNDGWVHHPGRTYTQGLKDALHDLKDWFAPEIPDADQRDDFKNTRLGKAGKSPLSEQHIELKRSILDSDPPPRIRGGRSDAPAVLVTVNKGHGIVDAFWFFFYSFNLGNVVLNIRFGNHVGDWEHTAIRFHHGVPKAVYFSEHNFGSAYSYDAVEKIGKRPVIYSAFGTHAMYATPGMHPYILPWGILHDVTDRGPLWDPALNAHSYTYDYKNETLRSSNLSPNAPIGWFDYAGHWGDKFYPLGDHRQYRFAGQYHYVNGPLGPKFKDLGRKKICAGPDTAPCTIKNWLGGSDKIPRVHLSGADGEDGIDAL